MFSLFVPIAHLQDFKTFKSAINVFNENSEFRKFAIKQFLLCCQSSISWFLKRDNAISMNVTNALKSLIANKQNEVHHVYSALLEKFKVMNFSFAFVYTNNLAG